MKTRNKIAIILTAVTASILIGCAVPTVTTNSAGQQVTNYVANPVTTQNGQTVPALAPLAPAPYGAIIGAVGSLIGLSGAGIATYKNSQANLHQSTLQAVAAGIETALPGVQTAITAAAPSIGTSAATTAQTVLSAVKASIASATVANGTANNLNTQLTQMGVGPSAK